MCERQQEKAAAAQCPLLFAVFAGDSAVCGLGPCYILNVEVKRNLQFSSLVLCTFPTVLQHFQDVAANHLCALVSMPPCRHRR